MPSVQFFGIEGVIDAAQNLNCPTWGLFIGRSLFSKYEATDMNDSISMLEKNLEVLQNSDSNTVYTLKFFEAQPGKPIKITERSVCDGGSFNFKLVDVVQLQQQRIGNAVNWQGKQLEEKILSLEKTITELKAKQEPEEPQSLGAIFTDLLQKPDELGQLVNIGRALFGLPVQNYNIGAIGSISRAGMIEEGNAVAGTEVDQEAKLQRLGTAIDTLEKSDPRLVEHLEKLAQMAQENPGQFKATVSMLDLK